MLIRQVFALRSLWKHLADKNIDWVGRLLDSQVGSLMRV